MQALKLNFVQTQRHHGQLEQEIGFGSHAFAPIWSFIQTARHWSIWNPRQVV
jgi:hypothetical protein